MTNNNSNGFHPEDDHQPDPDKPITAAEVTKLFGELMGEFIRDQLSPQFQTIASAIDPETIALKAAALVNTNVQREVENRIVPPKEDLRDAIDQMEPAQEAPAEKPKSVMAMAVSQDPIGSILQMATYVFEKWMAWEEIKFQRQDPYAFISALQQKSPLTAQVLGQMLAPDPLNEKIPTLLAHSATRAWDQALGVGRKQGFNEAMAQIGREGKVTSPTGKVIGDAPQNPLETPSNSIPKPVESSVSPTPNERPSKTAEAPKRSFFRQMAEEL